MLVNEAFVREIIHGREPLGVSHGVMQTGAVSTPMGPLPIIGVVKDSRFPNLREADAADRVPDVSPGQHGLRADGPARPDDARHRRDRQYVREAVQAVDKDVPIFDVHTLADEVDAALVRERLLATLVVSVSASSRSRSICVGLYGLMAFTVSRRTPEIGIRVALGATRSDVRWLIGRQALGVVLAGLAIGVPAAWILGSLASRFLSPLLFGLPPNDPMTMAAAIAVLVLVAMCAGLLPSRRAARIDPMTALRTD